MKVGLIDDGVYIDSEIKRNIRFTGEVLTEGKEVIVQITKNTPYSHGTICAKIMIKQFSDIEIYSIKILREDSLTANIRQLDIAIEWCVNNEMALINLSLGSVNSIEFEKIDKIMRRAYMKDIIIVAAFNNNNTFTMPASLPYVIGVKSFKKRRGKMRKVKKSFIGENIIENSRYAITIENKKYVTPRCNSFAAPAVTGKLCEFLCSIEKDKKNNSGLGEIERDLTSEVLGVDALLLESINWTQNMCFKDVLKSKKIVPIIEYCGKDYILKDLFVHLMGENIFPIFIKDYQRNMWPEIYFRIIASQFDCDLIFIKNSHFVSKFVDMSIRTEKIIEIKYDNKIYISKSAKEGCEVIIELLS